MTVKLMIHTALCLLLIWSAWRRIVRTDDTTFTIVRLAFVWLAIAALALLIAPWAYKLWPWFGQLRVHWSQLLVLAAFVAVQMAVQQHWADGVPAQFTRLARDVQDTVAAQYERRAKPRDTEPPPTMPPDVWPNYKRKIR
jgi:hypothetical protein